MAAPVNGNGNGYGGLPQWVRSLVYAIRELGITTIVILALLGVFTGHIDSPLSRMATAMSNHERDTSVFYQYVATGIERQTSLTLRLCHRTAEDANDRRLCTMLSQSLGTQLFDDERDRVTGWGDGG